MKRNNLSKEKEILRVLRQRPFFSQHLTFKKFTNKDVDDWRYTVIISKKVEKLAVQRNRAKRRIRNIILKYKNKINKQYDFVIIINKKIQEVSFLDLKQELTNLLYKSKILSGYDK